MTVTIPSEVLTPQAKASEGSLRLNLGGMGEGFLDGRIPGFKVVDLRDGADYQRDVSDLSIFADHSVEEIYSSNVLEHFPIARTVPVLKEWHRVLKPRGKLWLSVPDFDACVRLYKHSGLTEWVQYLIWGDQKHPLNFHYINFTFATAAKALYEAGFRDAKRVLHLPYGIHDASEHLDNQERKPISLNVEATA
jgi:predicted SAM-dependent methyltransferase